MQIIPGMGGDMVNPLASQFGHLSLQDKAFLDAFNRQEQQELHGVPRPGPVDPSSLLGQLEQVSQGEQYDETIFCRCGEGCIWYQRNVQTSFDRNGRTKM
jgi:hypothetical protein